MNVFFFCHLFLLKNTSQWTCLLKDSSLRSLVKANVHVKYIDTSVSVTLVDKNLF